MQGHASSIIIKSNNKQIYLLTDVCNYYYILHSYNWTLLLRLPPIRRKIFVNYLILFKVEEEEINNNLLLI